jgi:hypothetical protein
MVVAGGWGAGGGNGWPAWGAGGGEMAGRPGGAGGEWLAGLGGRGSERSHIYLTHIGDSMGKSQKIRSDLLVHHTVLLRRPAKRELVSLPLFVSENPSYGPTSIKPLLTSKESATAYLAR